MPRGHPKVFDKEEYKAYVLDYMTEVYQKQCNGDSYTPTIFAFWMWLKDRKPCSFHTVRRCFDDYWADIKKDFTDMRGDLLVMGAAKGLYNPTITIFALKNWCGWKDKTEQTVDMKGSMSLESKIKDIKGEKF